MKTLCFLLTVWVDNRRCRYLKNLKSISRRVTFEIRNIITSLFGSKFPLFWMFVVSYTEPVENTWTKNVQNLFCRIEVSFTAYAFLIGKPGSFQQIHVISLKIPKLYCNAHFTSPVIIRFLFNVFSCHFVSWYGIGFTS